MAKEAYFKSAGWDWKEPEWRDTEYEQPKQIRNPDTADLCEDPADWEGEHTPEAMLAAAIVMQAVIDWRDAKERLTVQPFHEESQMTVEETEAFFLSDWFEKLTAFRGEKLLKKLKEERNV